MALNKRSGLVALLLLLSTAAMADESAAEISRKSRERGALNLVGLTASLKLTTTSAEGKVKEQVLTSSSRKVNGKDRSLSRFLQPAQVAGVAVLTVEGAPGEGNAISLYLPKLKRVRQVAQSDRGKAFMDTDFSYADVGGDSSRDAALERLPDVQVDGRPAFVLRGPAGPASPYGQITLTVDQQTYVPVRAEYQDKAGQPFKRYQSLKLKRFGERTLSAESSMENLQLHSKTVLQILELKPSTLGDDDFTERALERG